MKSVFRNEALVIVLYFVGVMALGAALAPVIFKIGKSLVASGSLDFWPYLHRVADTSNFQRYFNRAMMLSAVLCLWPAIKLLKVNMKKDFALESNPRKWSQFWSGFFIAGGFLMLMGFGLLQMGVFKMRPSISWSSFGGIAISAIAVGLIEEFLFRGLFFGLIRRTLREMPALWAVTFIFAIVHFLKPPDSIDIADAEVAWTTGFWIIGQIFLQFGNPIFIMAEFSTLFVVGLILGWARIRTASLWLAIGLHAGWVFGLKGFSEISKRATKPEETLPWIGENIKIGIVPFVMVSITGVIVHFLFLRNKKQAA